MRDFVCPDCGEIIKNDTFKNRKRCPRCAYIAEKKRICEKARLQREKNGGKKKAGRKPKEKPKVWPMAQQQKQADAEQNAQIREQRKQCKNCRFRLMSGDRRYIIGCDHLFLTGKFRDKGEGPGKCGSFEPIKNLKEGSNAYVQKGKAE